MTNEKEQFAVTFAIPGVAFECVRDLPEWEKADVRYDDEANETYYRWWTSRNWEASAWFTRIKRDMKDGELPNGTVRIFRTFQKWGM